MKYDRNGIMNFMQLLTKMPPVVEIKSGETPMISVIDPIKAKKEKDAKRAKAKASRKKREA